MDDGYEAEVKQQYLLVHQVPFVTRDRTVQRGTLVCPYVESAGEVLPPDNHQVWWTEEAPCFADGQPLRQILHSENLHELFAGCRVRHHFSNKPHGSSGFSEHYSKMVHYIGLISDQARVIDPGADARTWRVVEHTDDESVFRYADSASARAEILSVANRLAAPKIAIIGLGGTGAYVLDLVAKTPLGEIHLFDGDIFRQHNAFRAPGAAHIDDLRERLSKAEYFQRKYDPMRRGIVCHPYYLIDANLGELREFSFVFVCVDDGPARALIGNHLRECGTPYVDVGMDITFVPATSALVGTCRSTLVTPQQSEHVSRYVPTMKNDEENLYGTNIQVADMNMLNAALAVMMWKQHSGFYQDDFGAHHVTYSVNSQSLTRDVLSKVPSP